MPSADRGTRGSVLEGSEGIGSECCGLVAVSDEAVGSVDSCLGSRVRVVQCIDASDWLSRADCSYRV